MPNDPTERSGFVEHRTWERAAHGDRYEVIVKENGFLYDSKHYKSLTAVAMAITGSRWGGNRFFGLTPKSEPKRGNA